MRAFVAALVPLWIVVGCGTSEQAKPVTKGSAATSAPDPWNTPTKKDPNALPTIGERTKLANEACPAVTAPFFFAVTKNGKTSHILGTRHISVGLAKFPAVVGDTLDHASRAIFEISPDDTGGGEHNPEALKQELGPRDWAHFEELIGADIAQNFETGEPDEAARCALYEATPRTLRSQRTERAGQYRTPRGVL